MQGRSRIQVVRGFELMQTDSNSFGLYHLCSWVKIELNRSNSFMYGLIHGLRFIDLIKNKSNQ